MAEPSLDLGKKVGPLPLGAWIAVVAGGLGIAWYINRNAGGKSDGGSGLLEDPILASEPGVGVGGGQFISSPPTVVENSPVGFETNDQWARSAILHLLSEGKDPLKSTTAINKYVAELSVTAEEQALIGLAIAKLGPPPTLPVNPPPPPVVEPEKPVEVPLTPATGLKAVKIGTTSVALQWNKVPGAHSYRVYRKGVGTNIGGSMDTKLTVGGLKANTTYYFHVRALSSTGKLGPASASKTVRTKK